MRGRGTTWLGVAVLICLGLGIGCATTQTQKQKDFTETKFVVREQVTAASLRELGEELALSICKDEGTIQSYTAFIEAFPHSKYLGSLLSELDDKAYEATARIVEIEFFEDAERSNSLEKLKNYLARYPHGLYVREANEKTEPFYFEECVKQDSTESYQSYLQEYPNGAFIKIAKDRIEEVYFEECENRASIESYLAYLKEYPYGKYREAARGKM